MALFKKKDESLLQQVVTMRSQGLTDNQIIQALQQQNYPAHQIFDALSQADLKSPASPVPESYPPSAGIQQMPQQQSYPEQFAPQPQQQFPQYPAYPQPEEGETEKEAALSVEKIEEMVEAIVEERWEEISKNITKVIQWKDATEIRLTHMEDDIKEIKDSMVELRQNVIGKVSDYDQNISRVGAQLKAMENVFKDVLPSLTENVSELSRLTDKIKKTK